MLPASIPAAPSRAPVAAPPAALLRAAVLALACAACVATVRFSLEHRRAEQLLYDEALAQRAAVAEGMATVS